MLCTPSTMDTAVGIIVDGNGRWAASKGMSREAGHEAGAEALKRLVTHIAKNHQGIKCLYLYCFSTENWNRPESEVTNLFSLGTQFLNDWEERAKSQLPGNESSKEESSVRVVHLGRKNKIPTAVAELLERLQSGTANNKGLTVALCVDYGGREEIVSMAQNLARKAKSGEIEPEDIDEAMCRENLYDPQLPFPDCIIRTSGEMRWSNFLLYQGAYSEFYCCPKFFPDFTPEDFDGIIETLKNRERRFGGISCTASAALNPPNLQSD